MKVKEPKFLRNFGSFVRERTVKQFTAVYIVKCLLRMMVKQFTILEGLLVMALRGREVPKTKLGVEASRVTRLFFVFSIKFLS